MIFTLTKSVSKLSVKLLKMHSSMHSDQQTCIVLHSTSCEAELLRAKLADPRKIEKHPVLLYQDQVSFVA